MLLAKALALALLLQKYMLVSMYCKFTPIHLFSLLNVYSRLIGLPGHVPHNTGHFSWMDVEQQSVVAFSSSEHHDRSAQPRIKRSKNITSKTKLYIIELSNTI